MEKDTPKKKSSAPHERLALSAAEIIYALSYGTPYTAEPVPATLRASNGTYILTVRVSANQAEHLKRMNSAVHRHTP